MNLIKLLKVQVSGENCELVPLRDSREKINTLKEQASGEDGGLACTLKRKTEYK